MIKQNLIIYNFKYLYHILTELKSDLNLNFELLYCEKLLNEKIKKMSHYLIISNRRYPDINNQIFFEDLPINILKLLERINIEFLKLKFNYQSEININEYIVNLNSREMHKNELSIKLTEKEINTIIYLSKAIKPISINELKEKVWSYQTDIETHTVETHIYRLRKKFLTTFNDNKFIISKKNGYEIN